MSLRPVTRLLAAVVPALLLIPAAAHAEQVTVDDAAGDAKAFNFVAELLGGDEDGSAVAQLYPDGLRAVGVDELSGPSDPSGFRPCRTVRARYDVAADLVTVSFPATCVGSPRWVQVAVLASRLDITPLGDGSVNLAGYGDDAFRGGLSETSRGRSPKVRRG